MVTKENCNGNSRDSADTTVMYRISVCNGYYTLLPRLYADKAVRRTLCDTTVREILRAKRQISEPTPLISKEIRCQMMKHILGTIEKKS